MKAFLMGILGIIAYLIIPAAFGGAGVGIFLWLINPSLEARKVLKNGIETTAVIINIDGAGSKSSSSGNTTRNDNYFRFVLSFVNSDGNEIEYKTRGIYPEKFIRTNNIKKGEIVHVKYMDDKAVVKNFIPEYEKWLWAFPIVFGAIAAGFLAILLIGFLWIANDLIIKKFGTSVTGTYLEHKKFINANDSKMTRIICSIKNNNGETVKVKTTFIYSDSEAEGLAKMGSLPIKYIGEKAVIMIDKNDIEKK